MQNPHGMLNRAELTVSGVGHRKEPEQKSIHAQTALLVIRYWSVKSIVHSEKICHRAHDTVLDCPESMDDAAWIKNFICWILESVVRESNNMGGLGFLGEGGDVVVVLRFCGLVCSSWADHFQNQEEKEEKNRTLSSSLELNKLKISSLEITTQVPCARQ